MFYFLNADQKVNYVLQSKNACDIIQINFKMWIIITKKRMLNIKKVNYGET